MQKLSDTEFDIDYNNFDTHALIARDTRSQKVKLVKKCDGTGFTNIVLWTPPWKKASFFCTELWNGQPIFAEGSDDFEDKPYRIVLGAGKLCTVGCKVNVIR